MYNIHDTIAALSSSAGEDAARNIIRVSGEKTFEITEGFFSPPLKHRREVVWGRINIDDELAVDAAAYVFPSPNSYSGENMVEFHIGVPIAAAEAVLKKIISQGARIASPGEFTARAYLNGKLDLSQAEAVAQIVAGGNMLQLEAAQKLLAGRLSQTIKDAGEKTLDLISRIEAGLDFSQEDIEFITAGEAAAQINSLAQTLQKVLAQSVSFEDMISLPSVGIVGTSNAGKSSLLNCLLGQQRSIVSERLSTTRDVLTGVLKLHRCDCAIFDCAGLFGQGGSKNILDQLAQDAAIEAVKSAQALIFCVDISKQFLDEDAAIFEIVSRKNLIAAALKCDLLSAAELTRKIRILKSVFGLEFLMCSSVTGKGIDRLREQIEKKLTAGTIPQKADIIALNQRHHLRLQEAIKNLEQAKDQIQSDNEEVAVVFLRNCYRTFEELSNEGLDEAVLDRIFSRFCIGK